MYMTVILDFKCNIFNVKSVNILGLLFQTHYFQFFINGIHSWAALGSPWGWMRPTGLSSMIYMIHVRWLSTCNFYAPSHVVAFLLSVQKVHVQFLVHRLDILNGFMVSSVPLCECWNNTIKLAMTMFTHTLPCSSFTISISLMQFSKC